MLLLLATGPVFGQGSGTIRRDGSELFRFALHKKGLEPIANAHEANQNPNSTIIVILGDTNRLPAPFQVNQGWQFRNFVSNGGALLIATDRRNDFQGQWAQVFQVQPTGHFVTARADRTYQNEPNKPFIKPRQPPDRGRRAAPFAIFEGVSESGPKAIATDRPSTMRVPNWIQDCEIDSLAGYPDGARVLQNGQLVPPADNHFAFSIRPQFLGPGRILILADQSVFANGMMGFPDSYDGTGDLEFSNGNWGFTNRTIDYLKDGPQQPRTRCLFIENGEIIKQFAVPKPETPKPPIPNLPPEVMANLVLNSMNPIIDEAQKQNFFNRVLERWLGLPRILRMFIYVVTVLFVFAGLRWLTRGQRKPEPGTTLSPTSAAALLPHGGVLKQRTAAQIEVGNLFEAAARRVRDRFDVLGGRPGADGKAPPILIAGDAGDGPLLRRTVEWLWALGYGDRPIAVAPTEWDQMNSLLERVMVRASRGHWSFGQEAA